MNRGGVSAAVARPDGYSPAYSEAGDNPREMLTRGEELTRLRPQPLD